MTTDTCPNCDSGVVQLMAMDAITCTNEDCELYEVGWRPEEVRE